ncbi:MAG TPA: YceI family protein [Flavisolibacter sp.]
MLKRNLIVILALLLTYVSLAQGKYYTKTGKISFYSKAPLEEIEGKNKTVTAVLDSKSGAMQFAVEMKGFEFQKQLMQQHFNENYVESDKYPKGEFKGAIVNNSEINYSKDGTYTAKVKGKLTIHGVTKDVESTGTLKINGGKIDAASTFNVLMSDYNIKIPAIVKDKVSNNIKITVDCDLEPLKG